LTLWMRNSCFSHKTRNIQSSIGTKSSFPVKMLDTLKVVCQLDVKLHSLTSQGNDSWSLKLLFRFSTGQSNFPCPERWGVAWYTPVSAGSRHFTESVWGLDNIEVGSAFTHVFLTRGLGIIISISTPRVREIVPTVQHIKVMLNCSLI
jgi:hypothetical protein